MISYRVSGVALRLFAEYCFCSRSTVSFAPKLAEDRPLTRSYLSCLSRVIHLYWMKVQSEGFERMSLFLNASRDCTHLIEPVTAPFLVAHKGLERA